MKIRKNPKIAEKLKRCLLCGALIFVAAAILCRPQRYIPACFEGVCLWAECVLPSLLPFMVICSLLVGIGAIDAAARRLKKPAAAMRMSPNVPPLFLTSLICGYPAGSRLVANYCACGKISRKEARLVAPLCSVCSPLFAIGTIGVKAFSSAAAGAKLFACSVLSVAVSYGVFSFFYKCEPQPALPTKRTDENLLQSAFYGSAEACIAAGAFICFFYTLAQIIDDYNIFMPFEAALSPIFGEECAAALFSGLCEATGGCFAAAKCGNFFALPVCGFLTTFGGASIILQQMFYLKKCGVPLAYFTAFKLFQGALCFMLLCACAAI